MKTFNTPFARSVARSHSSGRRAFTLIELLIVIGLTAVLFALLLIPLVSAINYTRQAQVVTAAQDAARITRERLTRELGSAMFVFDGTSHPFLVTGGAAPGPGDDRYTNFLDLEIGTSLPGVAPIKYKTTLAHAYAAKLDFVLPRANQTTVEDPTTHESITYRSSTNGSAIVSDPAYVFPLAAGTTMIRYWIGLKDPAKPYNNTHEGKFNDSSDNTYILYRAQFQPYKPVLDPVTKKQTGVTANTDLFKTRPNNLGVMIPELDDPDFFRYVGTTDVNWLDDTHANYPTQDALGAAGTAGSFEQHNNRVEAWRTISKPVILGPNVDLILLPHNNDNTLAYDKLTTDPGYNASVDTIPGVAHNGTVHDPVAGGTYPIVNPSVTFRPATVSGDAVPGTTSDYGSQALPTSSGQTSYGYVPTFYTATSRSWSLPFHISIYPGNYDAAKTNGQQVFYDTEISSSNDLVNKYVNAGDLLEYRNDTGGRTLVFNITQGYPITGNPGNPTLGGSQFVPLTVNPDNGTLNFGSPSLPAGPVGLNRNQRNWSYSFNATAATDKAGGVGPDAVIDLTKPFSATPAITDSPLTTPGFAPSNSNTTGVKNAHIVPGGIRVTGPDTTAGPNNGKIVPYVEVSSALAGSIGENQYIVDYAHNTIQISPDALAYLVANPSATIVVVYDYQANLTLTDPTQPFSESNPYLPMQVKLDYQTRDLIDVSIGVRIYDYSSNRAQVIPAQTKIKIGNSNR